MSAKDGTSHASSQSSTVELRDATYSDIPSLVELAGAAFYDAYIEFDDHQEILDYIRDHLTEDYFSDAIKAPGARLEVLADKTALIGYLLVTDSPGPDFVSGEKPLELARIYLRGGQTRRGHGRRLMQRVFELARQDAFDRIWLQVYDKNTLAIEFYQRFGFVERGTLDFLFAGRLYKDPVMVARVDDGVASC